MQEEHSGSVLDLRLGSFTVGEFETHCVVSLSKTFLNYPLLSTDSIQELSEYELIMLYILFA